METAVVSDSPRKAGYFTPMMLSELANTPEKAAANWPLMVWRKYLPKHVRDGAKAMFLAAHPDDGDDLVREIQGITTRYVLAQTATAMFDAVVEMAAVLKRIQAGLQHGRCRSRSPALQGREGRGRPVDPVSIRRWRLRLPRKRRKLARARASLLRASRNLGLARRGRRRC